MNRDPSFQQSLHSPRYIIGALVTAGIALIALNRTTDTKPEGTTVEQQLAGLNTLADQLDGQHIRRLRISVPARFPILKHEVTVDVTMGQSDDPACTDSFKEISDNLGIRAVYMGETMSAIDAIEAIEESRPDSC